MEYSYQLTPQELLFLAKKLNKKSVFGIPAGSETQEQSSCADALLKKGYMDQDFTGEIQLCHGIRELVDVCASCSRYLTVNRRSADGNRNRTIWKAGTQYWYADRKQQTLHFSKLRSEDLRDKLLTDAIHIPELAGEAQAIVPQMLLIKAKRFQAKRDAEGAAQLLIKNHVPDEMAHMIACGLMEQGEFYSAVLADQAGNTRSLCVIVPKTWRWPMRRRLWISRPVCVLHKLPRVSSRHKCGQFRTRLPRRRNSYERSNCCDRPNGRVPARYGAAGNASAPNVMYTASGAAEADGCEDFSRNG